MEDAPELATARPPEGVVKRRRWPAKASHQRTRPQLLTRDLLDGRTNAAKEFDRLSPAGALDQRFISGLLRETPMLSRVLEEETAESIRLTNRIAIDHRQLSKHARLYHRRGVARRDRDLGHRRDLGRAGR
jgi:hypothetical protein